MKNLILFFATCTLFCCTSEDKCLELNCELLGEWTWTRTYGSIAGGTWTPELNGYEKHIEIGESDILFYRNDTLIETYFYEVFETDTLFTGGILASFIKYDDNTRRYSIKNGTLEINDLCFDCFDDFYEKN